MSLLISRLANYLPARLVYLQQRALRRARTLLQWFQAEGLRGVARRVVHHLRWSQRFARTDADFDTKFGVDTKGPVGLWHLQIPSRNVRDAKRYEGVNPTLLRDLLRGLLQDFSKFTFVDLGCGKGRALLIASEFGFAELIGVEFAPELARTARENCRRLGVQAEILQQDASDFEFPAGNLVVFFYNPFGPTVLAPVIERLVSTPTGESFVIYVNPQHRQCIEGRPRMVHFATAPGSAIWKLAPAR